MVSHEYELIFGDGGLFFRSTTQAQGLEHSHDKKKPTRRIMHGWIHPQGRPVFSHGPPSRPIGKVVRSRASKVVTSAPAVEHPGKFKSALLDYSKAIIKSGMDCEDAEAQSLEANIVSTRERVIATHDATVSKLDAIKSTCREQKRQLEETITIYGQEKKGLEGELRVLRTAEAKMKERSAKDKKDLQKYKAVWEKELKDNKKLEDEPAQLRNESRIRRRVEEIWERAEKVKMD